MHLYSPNGHIKKYNTIEEIMLDYYLVRLKLYEKRKLYQLEILSFQLKLISYKVKFILMIINKEININNIKKLELEIILKNKNFQYWVNHIMIQRNHMIIYYLCHYII